MNKQTLVFLGSKEIGSFCLDYLLQQSDSLGIDIVAVCGRKKEKLTGMKTVNELALEHSIPSIDSVNEIPTCDFILSVQHHEILKTHHIARAQQLAINLHMAPLPEYRGCNQFTFALLDERREFGTSLHVLDEGIDSGDLLAERRFSIPDHCWVDDLYNQTVEESKLLFEESIGNIFNGNYTLVSQDSLMAYRGCSFHYRKEIEGVKEIDESWPQRKKEKYIRATFKEGFEPPYYIKDNIKIYYTKTSI